MSIIFLSGDGVQFIADMDDEWYRATSVASRIGNTLGETSGDVRHTYRSEEAASPMGCVEQWQWCNPAYPGDSGCGPLASYLDSCYGAAPFFNLTEDELSEAFSTLPSVGNISNPYSSSASRLVWPCLVQYFLPSSLPNIIGQVGTKSLDSQSLLFSGVQFPLPRNQWQLDATNWFHTVLASIQAAYVGIAQGTRVEDLQRFRFGPQSSMEKTFCNSQVSWCI